MYVNSYYGMCLFHHRILFLNGHHALFVFLSLCPLHMEGCQEDGDVPRVMQLSTDRVKARTLVFASEHGVLYTVAHAPTV